MTKRIEQPSADKLAEINEKLEGASPQEILLWAHEELGNDVTLMSSFGLEDMALLDMFWRITQDARVMTLDTLRLPTETYTLFDQTSARYGINIEAFYPDMDEVRAMVEECGFNLFYKGIDNRKMCCGVRKVEPLGRALNSVNGWITGLRRDTRVWIAAASTSSSGTPHTTRTRSARSPTGPSSRYRSTSPNSRCRTTNFTIKASRALAASHAHGLWSRARTSVPAVGGGRATRTPRSADFILSKPLPSN